MKTYIQIIALFLALAATSAGSAYLAFEASPEPIVLTETVEVEKPVEVIVTRVVEKEVPVEVEVAPEYDQIVYIALLDDLTAIRVSEDYEPEENTLFIFKVSVFQGNKILGAKFIYKVPGDDRPHSYTMNMIGVDSIAAEIKYQWTEDLDTEEDEF